jgi:hypothetical protein
MANYNFIERKCAKILGENPKLKSTIKRIYQTINYYIHNRKVKSLTEYSCSPIYSLKEEESFFGYYDKSPIMNDLELFQSTSYNTKSLPGHTISKEGSCNIIVKNIKTNEVKFNVETLAFNWQQGSKLQWLSSGYFIYNDIVDNSPVAKLVNLNDGKIKTLFNPVYDTFKNDFYISLDYRPLEFLRPDYAYFNKNGWGDIDYLSQSIILCDFDDNSQELICIKSINENYPLNFECDSNKQKFNHISISPCGRKFVFLHRAYSNAGKRIDRLFMAQTDPNDLKLRLISDSGMISHYNWIDSEQLIAFMRHDGADGYHNITLSEGIIINKIEVTNLDNYGDGHPTSIRDGVFITDTYPNKARMKSLILVDIYNDNISVLGEFLEPLTFGGQTRCDLHPKWDPINKFIYVDSVHEGNRRLYKLGPIQ